MIKRFLFIPFLGWRIIDDKSAVFSTNQNATIIQPQANTNSQQMHTNTSNSINISQMQSQVQQQPIIQLQKVQPQKHVTKPRQPKQTAAAKALQKPTLKSSPIVVNEIKTEENKPAAMVLKSNEMFNASKIMEMPIKTEVVTSKPHLITTSSANEIKMSSKVVPPIITTQRKLNNTKAIVSGMKLSAATIKPKIVGKSLQVEKQMTKLSNAQNGSQKTVSNVSLSSSSSPQTFTITTAIPNNKSKLDIDTPKPIIISKQQILSTNLPVLNNNNSLSMNQVKIEQKILSSLENGTFEKRDIPAPKVIGNYLTKASTVNAQQTAIPTTSASNSFHLNALSTSQIHSNATTDTSKSIPSQFNQNHINLPVPNSIQLPTAPYAPIYANGK